MKWLLSHNLLLQYFFSLFGFILNLFLSQGILTEWDEERQFLSMVNIQNKTPLNAFISIGVSSLTLPSGISYYLGGLVILLDVSVIFKLLAHTTLVTLSASRNPYDTCFPQFTLWNIQLSKWKITHRIVSLSQYSSAINCLSWASEMILNKTCLFFLLVAKII